MQLVSFQTIPQGGSLWIIELYPIITEYLSYFDRSLKFHISQIEYFKILTWCEIYSKSVVF